MNNIIYKELLSIFDTKSKKERQDLIELVSSLYLNLDIEKLYDNYKSRLTNEHITVMDYINLRVKKGFREKDLLDKKIMNFLSRDIIDLLMLYIPSYLDSIFSELGTLKESISSISGSNMDREYLIKLLDEELFDSRFTDYSNEYSFIKYYTGIKNNYVVKEFSIYENFLDTLLKKFNVNNNSKNITLDNSSDTVPLILETDSDVNNELLKLRIENVHLIKGFPFTIAYSNRVCGFISRNKSLIKSDKLLAKKLIYTLYYINSDITRKGYYNIISLCRYFNIEEPKLNKPKEDLFKVNSNTHSFF